MLLLRAPEGIAGENNLFTPLRISRPDNIFSALEVVTLRFSENEIKMDNKPLFHSSNIIIDLIFVWPCIINNGGKEESQLDATITVYYYFFTGATTHCGFVFCSPLAGLYPPRVRGFLITHNDAPQSLGLLWTSDQSIAETFT
jgi:hypothetical protein